MTKTASGLSLRQLKGGPGAALERASDLAEVVDFMDLAEAAKALAQTQEQKLYAEEWHLRGQRKAGGLLDPPKGRPKANAASLAALLGTETDAEAQHLSSRWQAVAAVPDSKFEEYIEFGVGDEDITRAGLLRYDKHGRLTSSESPEYYTPAEYAEASRVVLDGIGLDPASNAEANRIIKARRFFTAEDDGLSKPWKGTIFLNPPYGRLTGPFVLKLVEEFEAGRTTAGILLISAHTTDTSYFQPLWDRILCFTDHRLPWYGEGGERTAGATFGSVFAYFGPDWERFATEFERFGAIVARWGR